MMRIRIVRTPPIRSIDGIRLDCFVLGAEYEMGNSLGSLFLSEGWAIPASQDGRNPRRVVRETFPPYLDTLLAADVQRRARPRRK
jgi:hypothetical protein